MIKLNTEYLKQIFTKYDYIMTTAQLNLEKLYYRDIYKCQVKYPQFCSFNYPQFVKV